MADHVKVNHEQVALLMRHIDRIHDSVVEDVEQDAKMRVPVDTGYTRSTIHTEKVRPLLSHVVVGGAWKFIEYATSAHLIRPKEPGGALFWPGAPHPVQVVLHPGTSAQPFMRPALYTRRSLAGRPYR